MSKEFNAKLEVDKILTKSQKDLLNKIESYRLQIKEIRERELSKSLIPVHEHRAGSTVGMGTEDVPPSKANPKGIDKNMGATPPAQGVNKPPPPMPSPVAKAEMCKKCGNMHMPLDKCGDIKMNAKKSELVDEKGKVSSNSVNSPHPEPKKVVGDKGGIRLPGASLKKDMVFGNKAAPGDKHGGKSGYQITQPIPKLKPAAAGMATVGEHPSTGAQGNAVSLRAKKSELEKATPPGGFAPKPKEPSVAMSGNNGPHSAGRPLPKSELEKATKESIAAAIAENVKAYNGPPQPHKFMKPSGTGIGGNADKNKKTCHHCNKPESDEIHKSLEKALTAGGANAAPSTLVNGDALAGKGKKGPKKPVSLQVQPDPERKSEVEKAEPPMAKPPSGKNMATHVPTSTAKKAEPMAKGLFSDAAKQSDPSAASFAAHSAANAKPQGKLPKMGGPNAAASARAADFADAMSGQTPPKTAVPQAQPFASPKAAGVTPLNPANKPPAIAPVLPGKGLSQAKPATAPAKPGIGIFGKIGGFRKP